MSRKIFWSETKVVAELIEDESECRYKVNSMCFNNYSKMLGKKCHGCEDFIEEINL